MVCCRRLREGGVKHVYYNAFHGRMVSVLRGVRLKSSRMRML